MKVIKRGSRGAFVGLALFILSPGCQTTPDGRDEASATSSRIPFAPRMARVTIQAAEGSRYPNLFTSASYADWGGAVPAVGMPASAPAPVEPDANLESIAPEPVAASEVVRTGLTIVCRMESEFPDRSIAYDAVGLRGMTVALVLPSGEEVAPSQKILHSDLEEVPVGALRRYARNLTLHFPEQAYLVENPATNPSAVGMRLVLRGGGAEFFFHWPATPDFGAVEEPDLGERAARTTRNYFRTTREAISRTSHTFD